MEEGREALHDTENGNREHEPEGKGDDSGHDAHDARHAKHILDCHVPEHLRELRMCERECPKTEVRRRVGDAAEAELDCVDDLVDDHFADLERLFLAVLVLVERVLVDEAVVLVGGARDTLLAAR